MSIDDEVRGRRLRRLPTVVLTSAEVDEIRALLDDAFWADEDERFTDLDWDHARGGLHFVLDVDGVIVAHAAVVERDIRIDGRPLRTGYVEAVATAPTHQGRGFGTEVMAAVTDHIGRGYELGALGTGRPGFYERLGWRRWAGRAYVRTVAGARRTPDDEGFLLVLATPASPPFDLTGSISCDWRPGDAW